MLTIITSKSMARKDWFYVPIPVEQGEVLDYIIDKDGKKYGLFDKNQLVRTLVSDFIEKYELHKNLMGARKAVKGVNDDDFAQPL